MGDQGCAIIARGATVDEVISKLEERRDKINFMQQIKRVGIREEIETLVAKSGELGIPF